MSEKNIIHLAIGSDQKYFNFVIITLYSILYYYKKGNLVIHLFHPDLTEDYFQRLEQLKKIAYFDIHPIKIDQQKFKEVFGENNPNIWRLALPALLPDIDKLLYCDCDLVFCDNIINLWDIDLGNKMIGAVRDRVGFKVQTKIPINPINYCNSGVMLWNLRKMREQNVARTWPMEYRKYKEKLTFPDQDFLNILYKEDILILHQKWNIINSVYRNPPIPDMYSAEEITEAIRHPGIVHFTGHHKPWLFFKNTHHVYARCFWFFALKSPIPFGFKTKMFIKKMFFGRYHDSKVARPWSYSDINHQWD